MVFIYRIDFLTAALLGRLEVYTFSLSSLKIFPKYFAAIFFSWPIHRKRPFSSRGKIIPGKKAGERSPPGHPLSVPYADD